MSLFRRRLLSVSENTSKKKDYLKFDILTSGTITFVFKATTPSTSAESISYSMDNGDTWTTFVNTPDKTSDITLSINVEQDDTILWKGSATCFCPDNSPTHSSKFGGTASFDVSGNIMSLLSNSFESLLEIPSTYCFAQLFSGTKVVNAYYLSLPATTLKTCCYRGMMRGCTSLITAPSKIVASGTNYSWGECFNGCTNLVNIPEFPTGTSESCYINLFLNCKNITSCILPFTGRLAKNAYRSMFGGASKLNYIKALHTSYNSGGMYQWVNNVASSGIFVKNINATWTDTGNSGVPTNWTIIYYDPNEDKYYTSQDKSQECDDHGNLI